MYQVKFYPLERVEDYLERLPTFHFDNVVVNRRVLRDYKAVVRDDTEDVVAIVSSRYKLAQHRTVFKIFIEKLRQFYGDANLKGYVTHEGTRAFLFVTCKEIELKDDSVYDMGFMVTNSVDATMGIRVALFQYRLVCSNGLISKENIMEMYQKHVQGQMSDFWKKLKQKYEAVISKFDTYVDDTVKKLQIMKETVVKAWELIDKIDWLSDSAKKLLKTKVKKEDTLFNVYQALTWYFSNYPISRMTFNGRIERLQNATKVIEQAIQVKAR